MKEVSRTVILVAIAAVLSILSVMTIPSFSKFEVEDLVGKELFPKFTDPLTATSLEIVEFDEETATPSTFKVAQVNGQWSIPSHHDYPADAKDQLADVATDLTGLKVLQVVSGGQPDEAANTKKLEETYGVVDPGAKKLNGVTGVGTRVVMRDASDKTLVNLVVGKEVPDADGLHYVRVVGQDPIYVVKLDTKKLSTKFDNWIEKDLLKLNTWDIRQVHVEDYSIDILAGTLTPRAKITLDYNDTGKTKWKLAEDKSFGKAGWADRPLAEDEELNTDALDKLKTALDDLKIVDVARKPEGLSETLGTSGSVDNRDQEAYRSLQERGFYIVPMPDPNDPSKRSLELRSNEGEISVLTKEGVKYVLRFGQIAGTTKKNDTAKEDNTTKKGDTAKEGEEESSDAGVNRYLFVMAQFDRSPIAQPEYEELPQPEASDGKTQEKKEGADQASPKGKDGQAADSAKADKEKDKKAADDAKADKKEEGKKAADDAKTEKKKEDKEKAAEADAKKERERIEKENKRKKEEYEEKIKKGEDKVKELNARFADWYYVISDDVYQKIHLGRDKVVKKKEKKEEEGKENAAGSDAGAKGGKASSAPADSLKQFDTLKQATPGKAK